MDSVVPQPVCRPGDGRPGSPDAGGPRAEASGERRVRGAAGGALAVERAAHRPPLLSAIRRVRRVRGAVLYPGRSHRATAAVGDRTPDSLHRPGGPGLPGAGDRVRSRRLSVDRGDGRRRTQARERLHRHLGLHHQAAAARAHPLHENRYRTTQSVVRHQLPDDDPRPRSGGVRRTRARPTRLATTFCAATPSGCSSSNERQIRERCPGPDQHPGRRRRRRVLRQPRHVGDALRRRAGHRAADARCAGPLRGCGHRRRRRLCPHRRPSGGGAAAPGPRTGQRPGQPAQRAPRESADGGCRRRPRHLSQEVRRPTGIRHRRARRHRLGMGAPQRRQRRRRARHGRGHRGEPFGFADLDADPARGRILVRRRPARPAAAAGRAWRTGDRRPTC